MIFRRHLWTGFDNSRPHLHLLPGTEIRNLYVNCTIAVRNGFHRISDPTACDGEPKDLLHCMT